MYVRFGLRSENHFRRQWLQHFSGVSFAVVQKTSMQRRFVWETTAQFAFVASPPGNGFDCHRTWEALILGCIVIVQNSSVRTACMEQHPDFVSTFKRESVSLRRRPRHGLTKVLPWQVAMNSMYEDLAVAIVNDVREGQCAQAVLFACVALCCFKMAFKF